MIHLLEGEFNIVEWDINLAGPAIRLDVPGWDSKIGFRSTVGLVRVEYCGHRVQLGRVKDLQTKDAIEKALIEANNECLRVYDEAFQLARTMELHAKRATRKAVAMRALPQLPAVVGEAAEKTVPQKPLVKKTRKERIIAPKKPIQTSGLLVKKRLPKRNVTLLDEIRDVLNGKE